MVFPRSGAFPGHCRWPGFGTTNLGPMIQQNVLDQTNQILRELGRLTTQINSGLASTDPPVDDCGNYGSAYAYSSPSGTRASAKCSASSAAASRSINGDIFELKLNVHNYRPEEISVKLVDSVNLVVEGKHEERSEGDGFISRSFSRRYAVPDNYDPEKLETQLSLDGILTIKAPRRPVQGANGEKIIPITLTSNLSTFDPPVVPTVEATEAGTSSQTQDGNSQTNPPPLD